MVAHKLLLIISISIWSAFDGFAYAQAQPSRSATPNQTIPSEWLKEFPTATKEQRKVWPREKNGAYDDWLEAETARKLAENKRIEQENEKKLAENKKHKEELGQIQAKNEKLKRDNEILGSVAGRLKGETSSEKK